MAGRIIVIQGKRESVFSSDDYVVYAMERVIRERVTQGKSMFIEAPGLPETQRHSITVVIGPMTQLYFSYTDGVVDPPTGLIENLHEYVETHGGFRLNELDLPVEPY